MSRPALNPTIRPTTRATNESLIHRTIGLYRAKDNRRFLFSCHYIDLALKAPIFKYDATLVIFECGGNDQLVAFRKRQNSSKLAIVSYSSMAKQLLDPPDSGQLPLANRPTRLSPKQHENIQNCDDSIRIARISSGLRETFDIRCDRRLRNYTTEKMRSYSIATNSKVQQKTYEEFMMASKFAATPRASMPFRLIYRTLSAGAIPVVRSDGWVLPFQKELLLSERVCTSCTRTARQ
jgi:hypothetical protein